MQCTLCRTSSKGSVLILASLPAARSLMRRRLSRGISENDIFHLTQPLPPARVPENALRTPVPASIRPWHWSTLLIPVHRVKIGANPFRDTHGVTMLLTKRAGKVTARYNAVGIVFRCCRTHVQMHRNWQITGSVIEGDEMLDIWNDLTPPLRPVDIVKRAVGPKRRRHLTFSTGRPFTRR